jgi:biotin carboxylase
MSETRPVTVLCLASYEKGADFLRECKRLGCRVILLTVEGLAEAAWPRDSIDDILLMPTLTNREHVIHGVSYLARTQVIDRIVALDDYDVETAAALREHLRVPGMGDTTARYFRDKLAMRVKARESGITVPEFVPVHNYDVLRDFMRRVPPPWVLKPRSEAASVGIKKVASEEGLWALLDALGDRQSFHVLERFVPGDVYHVDAITYERKVVFAAVHKYGEPPMSVAHEGGVFVTRTLRGGTPDEGALEALNRELLAAFGFVKGVTHTEFIKAREDGRLYFLETGARVAGAHIAELVAAATGVNLWAEWAKTEIGGDTPYRAPDARRDYAGSVISLARQEEPDTSAYTDPEIVWRLRKPHHVGLIVASPDYERVGQLLEDYTRRFYEDFWATQPLPDKPSS